MTVTWQCPNCRALVRYEDYDRAISGAVFPCHQCRALLIIDRKTDQPVRVPDSETDPSH
jgi:hypothetical protein